MLGTLVSEGIVAYRVQHGLLPASGNRILDVGPSYVVVAAIMVALVYGSRRARVAAAADLAILVFIGQIFAGLSTLQVAAVGHATALVVGAAGGGLLLWQRRGTPADPASLRSRPVSRAASAAMIGPPGRPLPDAWTARASPRPAPPAAARPPAAGCRTGRSGR